MIYFIISGKLREYHTNLRMYLHTLHTLIDIKVFVLSHDDFVETPYLFEHVFHSSFNYTNSSFTQREINTVYQWYNIQTCFNLLTDVDISQNDILVRIRPDIKILEEPNKFIEQLQQANTIDGIIIPTGNDIFNTYYTKYSTHTINDQIAFGRYNFMKEYCSLFKQTTFDTQPIISESILSSYLEYKHIHVQRLSIMYSLCAQKCTIVSITGDSGVGKSTIATSLQTLFHNTSIVFETDRYHKWDRFSSHWKTQTHLNPSSNYLEKMLDDTYLIRLGEIIFQVDYDHSTGKFTDKQEIIPNNHIIICGLHTLSCLEFRELVDLKIFINVDPCLKQHWKIKRDMESRGYTYEHALSIFQQREKDYIEFIHPQIKYADIIINYSGIEQVVCVLQLKKTYSQSIYEYLQHESNEQSVCELYYSYTITNPLDKILYALIQQIQNSKTIV